MYPDFEIWKEMFGCGFELDIINIFTDNKNLKNQIEYRKYFELRGFIDPTISNGLWGIYENCGER